MQILEKFFKEMLLKRGLKEINDNDWLIVSDVDEIPNLENLNLNKIQNKIILFNQLFCCYKLNLFTKTINWYGSRMIKKDLKNPKWLRDIKSKKYSIFRLDILFSNKKYRDILFCIMVVGIFLI